MVRHEDGPGPSNRAKRRSNWAVGIATMVILLLSGIGLALIDIPQESICWGFPNLFKRVVVHRYLWGKPRYAEVWTTGSLVETYAFIGSGRYLPKGFTEEEARKIPLTLTFAPLSRLDRRVTVTEVLYYHRVMEDGTEYVTTLPLTYKKR